MAKRFTDTEKWKKGLLRDLDGPLKVLWLYICDDCDHAGIWHYEPDVAEIRCGFEYDWDDVREKFSSKIVEFDGGEKWFIPSFIEFQYGTLNPQNRAHTAVISKLEKYKLSPLTSPLQAPYKGLKIKIWLKI